MEQIKLAPGADQYLTAMTAFSNGTGSIPADTGTFYGRRRELDMLLHWIQQAALDNIAFIQVEGEAGVGKTTLIQQLQKKLQHEKSFFLYGKSDNRIEKVPYLPLKQALRQWMDILLTLPDKEFENLKSAVRQAAGSQHTVLTSVFEELELLFGKSGNTSAIMGNMDPQRVKQQFTYFFQKFLIALSQCGYTTTLFIDDLQWADRATFDLLLDLLTFYDIPDFLIISANRPVSISLEQPKWQLLRQNEKVVKLELVPMDKKTIKCFIPSAWQLQDEEAIAFEEYLMQESGGNPFLAIEIIDFIQQENLFERRSKISTTLQWHLLPKLHQNESAINLVQHKLANLSPLSLEIITTAACLGYSFSCSILSSIIQSNEQAYELSMQELERQNFLFRQGEQCYFIHDNIHTAAYSLLEGSKSEKHFAIANFLKELTQLDLQHACFFDTINHYNLAKDKIIRPEELEDLAILNWLAARLARQKSAFDRALDYLLHCKTLLPADATQNHQAVHVETLMKAANWIPTDFTYHQLYVAMQLGVAEGQFLTQQFEDSLQTLNLIFEISKDRFTLLQAYTIQMKICIAVINRQDIPHLLLNGIHITEQVLRQYQIELPQNEGEFIREISIIYEKVKQEITAHDNEWFHAREINTDREFTDLINFIVHALPLIFFVDVNKAKYLALAGLHMCMQKGFVPATPALFASSVWTLSVLDKDYEVAYRLGDISLSLLQKEEHRRVAHVVYHMATLNFYNWNHHYKEGIKRLDEATQLAFEAGDYNYVVFCATNARLLEIFMGSNLKDHLYSMMHHKLRGLHVHFVNRINFVFINYLTGQKAGFTAGKLTFPKSLIRETEYNSNASYHLHHVKEKLYFLSGQYKKAFKHGEICESLVHVYEAFQVGVEHSFFYCLTILQLMRNSPDKEAKYLPVIHRKMKELERLATLGSGNYLHKKWLIEAELAKLHHQSMEAIELYDKAISEALHTGFVNIAAISAELAGAYMLSLGKLRLALPYLKEAYNCYQKWGADAKLRWLEQCYPTVFKEEIEEYHQAEEVFQQTGSSITDMTAVYQTAMALSKELKLHDLIHTLLQIAMTHIKADRGVFLLNENADWQIKAEGNLQQISMIAQPLTKGSTVVPHKLINYVLRKKEKLWIQDLAQNKMFGSESYFIHQHVRAVVGVPVLHHQDVVGILYLEKRTKEGDSQHNQMQVLDIIASQAGISLTNALMYEDLQRLNQELQRQEQRRTEAIIETQEKERKRVAGELHDNLGQMLSLVKLNFSRLEDSIESQHALYLETSELLDETCAEIRKIAHNIMPPDFEKKTLVEILEALLRKQIPVRGLTYQFDHYQVPMHMPLSVKFNVYRVVQEIINNTIKHAQARKVTLQLIGNEEGLDVMVEDDGKGFDLNFSTAGLGLQNIHSRIQFLKGTVEVDSSLQRGTIYNIHLPISK